MSYAELTYRSQNPLKRLVQGNRYKAMRGLMRRESSALILDYGCGDGFFLGLLQDQGFRPDQLVGFEPFRSMAAQFRTGPGRPRLIDAFDQLDTLVGQDFTHIFCMEVLEHLDDDAMAAALDRIAALAGPATRIIVTVPSELGLTGAVKCLFRRLNGTEAVEYPTIRSVLLKRPLPRVVSPTEDGTYIFSHIGFDARVVEARLADRFRIERRIGVPFSW